MSHYFHTPTGVEQRRTVTARIRGEVLAFQTAAGVFSADGLDLGTGVLLRECTPPTGPVRVLDLGCGWGAIAVALARANAEARVDAIDVNERALALCRANADRLSVGPQVWVGRPGQVDPEIRYDEVWSNPPIRIGKDALHALLLSWLPRLRPYGMARLVVARNLGADSLQRWLGDQGWRCDRVASAKGFRVLEVRRTEEAP